VVPLNTDCRVIVMAKAPVAGYAKTRLIPALGADGAAQLAQRLLRHAIAQAVAAEIGPVELCCAPDARHAVFTELASDTRVTLSEQGEGDLGARMARALQRALAAHQCALLIGTDAPGLDARYLREAFKRLADHDTVLGPAVDGGYTLIGLRRFEPTLFEAMPWSTPQVLALTRERLHMAGLRHAELPPLHDIDEPADLVHLHGPTWA
jgi:rSAM/selenodomain-associated transferase 1